MDFLLQLDNILFRLINGLPHNIISDSFFAFFSGLGNFGIVWLIIACVLFIWEELKDKKGLIALVLSILLSIFISDGLIKNIVRRPRPEFNLESTIVVQDKRTSYSFPSGHTTIAFAAAFVLAHEHRKWAIGYYLIAFLIAFSRIYLGKHYPIDVLAGLILGSLIGFFSIKIISHVIPSVNKK